MLDLYNFLWLRFQFFIWNFGFWFVEFSLVGISTAVSFLLPQAILTHRITRHNRNTITNAAQILLRVMYKYCGNPHARCCNNTYPRWELCSEVRFEALKRQLGEYLKQQIGGFQPNLFFIGPESDHWLCLSLTHWLTNSLPFSKLESDHWLPLCEDANSKLVEDCYCCQCWWWWLCWQQFDAYLGTEAW